MPSFSLSKSRILAGLQCPKRLWLQTYQRELAGMTPATQAAFSTGYRVGEVARTLFPGGVLVEHVDNIPAALAETKTALRNRSQAVFEAAFSYLDALVRADILLLGNAGNRLILHPGQGLSPRRLRDPGLGDSWGRARARAH